MPAATLAQMPGSQRTIQFPEGHEGPLALRNLLALAGVDPEDKKTHRDISVNGIVTDDLDTEVPDGATVLLAERVAGA